MPLNNTCSAFKGFGSEPASSPGLFSILGTGLSSKLRRWSKRLSPPTSQLVSPAPCFLFLFLVNSFHLKRSGRLQGVLAQQPPVHAVGMEAQVQSPPGQLSRQGS